MTDLNKIVIDYLARKLSVSREISATMPDIIGQIMREPQAGLRSLFATLNRPEPKKLEEHSRAIERLVPKTSALPTVSTAEATERVPENELQRVEKAVAEAVRLQIVREEIFPARHPTTRVGYLLSGPHYGIYDFDPADVPERIKNSQIESFRLAFLLGKNGVRSAMRVEGRDIVQTYTPFRGMLPTIDHQRVRIDALSPQGQQILFEHPEKLGQLMDEQQRLCEQWKISTPIFYDYAAGLRFAGAHSAATQTLVQTFANVWLPWHDAFTNKYKSFFDAASPIGGNRVEMQMREGWENNGTPVIQMADHWWFTSDVIRDMNNYLRYADLLHELDIARESELAEYMIADPQDKVPMGFAGKAHEFMIVERLRDAMEVRVLTPCAGIGYDSSRRTLPINDPACTLLRVEMAQVIRRAAQNIRPRPPL